MSEQEKKPGISRIKMKKKPSKVSPSQLQQNIRKKGGIILTTSIAFIIVIAFLSPKHSSAIETKPHDNASSLQDTLQANLRALEDKKAKLKQKIDQKRFETMKLYRDGVKRPVIRKDGPEGQPLLPLQPLQMVRPINPQQSDQLTKEMMVRMNAQTTFFSKSVPTHQKATTTKNPDGSVNATIIGQGVNSHFLNSNAGIENAKASFLSYPEETVPAGELISATLETAVNSELPGMVRAITTRDIYSFRGRNRLIPKGSSVVGQFSSQVVQGQSRLLVIWNRLMLPSGTVVALNSPGTDPLGRSGQGVNSVDTHFMQRFGSSALLSVLGLYAATGGVSTQDQMNSISQYRQALSASFQGAAQQNLQKDMQIAPTLHIHQGSKINIFVSRDLSFHGVYGR